ncbi:hypothetical protein ACLOJK_029543 [Asimina triloba]
MRSFIFPIFVRQPNPSPWSFSSTIHSTVRPALCLARTHHPQPARIDPASGDFPQRIQIHDSSNCPMPASQHRPRSQQITPTSNSSSSVRSPLPNPSAPSAAPHSNRTIRQHHAIRRCPASMAHRPIYHRPPIHSQQPTCIVHSKVAHLHPIQSLPVIIRPSQIMAKPIGHQRPLIERRWQLRPCCRTRHFAPNEFHLPSGFRNLQQPHRPAAEDLIFRRIVNQKVTPFPSAINDATNSNQRRPQSAQEWPRNSFKWTVADEAKIHFLRIRFSQD